MLIYFNVSKKESVLLKISLTNNVTRPNVTHRK